MGLAKIGDTTISEAHGARREDKPAYYMTTVVDCDANNLCKLLCITVADGHIDPKIIDFFVDEDEEPQQDDHTKRYTGAVESLAGKDADAIIIDALLILREEYSSGSRSSSEQDVQDLRAIETELQRRGVPAPSETQRSGRDTPS